MSAIAGIHYLNYEVIPDGHGLGMMQALSRFPADAVQIWRTKDVFLGCRAQWITPESEGERLPRFDSLLGLAITADAILDNREELLAALGMRRGQAAPTVTDSELILLAYDRWGDESPSHLIGDFAFVIWDEKRRRLFGARDFSGGRTLYYHRSGAHFAFCSTIAPLLALPYVAGRLNEQWLAEYLAVTASVDTVDASMTPHQYIEQLPPSCSLTVNRDGVRIKRYCTLEPGEPLRLKSDGDYVEAFREVFGQAVSARLRTRRGVSAHLSGGLDSGSVVGFAAQALAGDGRRLHTFSYIPEEDFRDYTPRWLMPDERPMIRETVRHLGPAVNAHYLDFPGRHSYADIDGLLDTMEMPYKFFENSFWIRGMFEQAQAVGAGVLLSGARGNLSISWGSALDHYATLMRRLKWVRLIRELHRYSMNAGGARLRRLPLVARMAFPALDRMLGAEPPYTFPQLISPAFAERTGVYDKLAAYGLGRSGWFESSNVYEHRLRHYKDLFHWNATNTLTAKLSLRHAVWQRDPTNDIRVIRFCLSVPEEQYVKDGYGRALIRRATKTMLPDPVRLNQRIRGVQGADWVHRMAPAWNDFRSEVRAMLADGSLMAYLNGDAIRAALDRMPDGPRPELAADPDCRMLMRSLIVFRYLKGQA